MKKLKNLGKVLDRRQQQEVFGGLSATGGCETSCFNSDFCGDPNHSCICSPCTDSDGGQWTQCTCQCTTGIR